MNNPITVSTTVRAAPETVWNAFNTPQHVEGWNFATPEWECNDAHADLREGGRFGSRMAAKDGSMSFKFGGTYTRVAAPHALAYRMDDGREAEVTFEALPDGQTRVTERFDAEPNQPREAQQMGWQAVLDNFRRYVEGL